MKNNKTTTYILLLIVMGLWIVVFYRIYKSFFDQEEDKITVQPSSVKTVKLEETETFVLKANYADPFMGKSSNYFHSGNRESSNTPTRKPSSIKVKKPKPEEEKIDWSFINYLGLIKNQQSKKMVALIVINGKQRMVSEGDIIEDVSFIKNFKDSVKVSYQGKTTFIKR